MADNSYINIYDLCENGTKVLGPGLRYVIWTQGCPFNCNGCITPDSIPIIENKIISTDSIAERIILNKNIYGITVSGGEPFLQASRLEYIVNKVLLERPELTIVVFTGYKIEDLVWLEAKELLAKIDVLIDGQYIEKKNDNKALRGSNNQRIHFLTNRLLNEKYYFFERQRGIEIQVKNGYLDIIGIPNKEIKI